MPPRPPRLPRSTSPWPPRQPDKQTTTEEFPARKKRQGRTAPGHIRQVPAGVHLGGVTRRFLTYSSPSRSPDPPHLTVLKRPGFVGAACHPPWHLPSRAAPSFNHPAAT